jgi:hypothetical protein
MSETKRDWQAIESAPRDETPILGIWLGAEKLRGWFRPQYGVVWWRQGAWSEPEDDNNVFCEPSYWMPLPEPPTEPT